MHGLGCFGVIPPGRTWAKTSDRGARGLSRFDPDQGQFLTRLIRGTAGIHFNFRHSAGSELGARRYNERGSTDTISYSIGR